jgi:hypothetical protein
MQGCRLSIWPMKYTLAYVRAYMAHFGVRHDCTVSRTFSELGQTCLAALAQPAMAAVMHKDA